MWIERTKLPKLKAWLQVHVIGYNELEPTGEYEVMRWQGDPGEPMPIIYRSDKSRLLTIGIGARKIVEEFICAEIRKEE